MALLSVHPRDWLGLEVRSEKYRSECCESELECGSLLEKQLSVVFMSSAKDMINTDSLNCLVHLRSLVAVDSRHLKLI